MFLEWTPSRLGRLLTRSANWRLLVESDRLVVAVGGEQYHIAPETLPSFEIKSRMLWSELVWPASTGVRFGGLSNLRAPALHRALNDLLKRSRCQRFDSYYAKLSRWLAEADHALATADQKHRCLTYENQQALLGSKPSLELSVAALKELLDTPEVRAHLNDGYSQAELDIERWTSDWASTWEERNKLHTKRELRNCRQIFDKVESKPLTDEQAEAVVCFDNRVQVVASAGSGKTSTMIAKAIYAMHREIVSPKSIVMLAYNKDAAAELQARAKASLERLGKPNIEIAAMTFHSLGLKIIGSATGSTPHVPAWARKERLALAKLAEIVDDLKDKSPAFRTRWDIFRLVFGRHLPLSRNDKLFDTTNSDGEGKLVTLKGEEVASQEECIIANWLFYNGVEYQYEREYEHPTATAEHRQYFPDFFYPGLNLYHEHFALDAEGQPPEQFKKYLEGVAWKRQIHKQKGTQLIETHSHNVRSGEAFTHLAKELTDRGIKLDPNPDRPIPFNGLEPIKHADLLGLIRTFINHFKSNCYTEQDLKARVAEMDGGAFKYRFNMFVDLLIPVIKKWDKALAAENGIDFEDMINKAAGYLEAGHRSPYDLVMADEYQDASRARARLCKALVRQSNRFLFAVGDDWQSINRFAGADVSVMTGFKPWYGHGQVLRLETTFRCPQAICDVSSRFVSKNPAQFKKNVNSVTAPIGPAFQAIQVEHRNKVAQAIDKYVERLYQQICDGSVPLGRGGKVNVFVLGRYKLDAKFLSHDWQQRFGDRMAFRFKTVHTSKGDEADYVILPGMVMRGFPNVKVDDPLFSLVMPQGDTFPSSEERRLFYVALTRARRSVAMFTVAGRRSSFLQELIDEGVVAPCDNNGRAITQPASAELKSDRVSAGAATAQAPAKAKGPVCPGCKVGELIWRRGPYGEFQSCSTFPRCKYKPPKKRM